MNQGLGDNSSPSLLSERASFSDPERLAWKMRPRGDQAIEWEERREIEAFDGKSGIEIRTLSRCVGKSFSYLRGEFSLAPAECSGKVRFEIQFSLNNAPGVVAVVAIYGDPQFGEELLTVEQPVPSGGPGTFASLVVNFGRMLPRTSPVYGFVQICLPVGLGAKVAVGQISATAANGLRIRIDTYGDESKASSRLRAWKFVELLRRKGHDVRIGGGPGNDLDLYICQKVRPFEALAAIRKASPQATIVYDFDDDFVSKEQGTVRDLIAFINQVQAVTCGSEFLAAMVRRWHPNVYVLENPLDVEDAGRCRVPSGKLARIGWFGAPEGLMELAKTGMTDSVQTVTLGGDIEFNLRTIDEDLIKFDLLLFPVEETPWNLAKNANRMMKALALGIPVLVSGTPEQTRVAELVGLPHECIVHSPDEWKQAIERMRTKYVSIEAATLKAREKLWLTHSPTVILDSLLNHLSKTTRGLVKRGKASTAAFRRISVLVVDGTPELRALETLSRSSVVWADFHSIHLLCAKKLRNELFQLPGNNFHIVDGDFLKAFEAADRVVAETDAEYLLVIPAGVALAYGAAVAIEEAMEHESATLFVRNAFMRAARIGDFGEPFLRELFLCPEVIGPLLVKSSWARDHANPWQLSYDLWPWAVAVKALAQGNGVARIDLPFAFEAVEMGELNVSRQYAGWLANHRPEVAADLASPANQWVRILSDIVAEAARDIGSEFPSIAGHLVGRHTALRQRVTELELELRELREAPRA